MKKNLRIDIDDEEEKKVMVSPQKTRRNDIIIQHAPSTTATASHRYFQQQQQQQSLFQLQQVQKKKDEEQDTINFKTIVKQENNMEIFVSDIPEVDFDKLNEDHSSRDMEKYDNPQPYRESFAKGSFAKGSMIGGGGEEFQGGGGGVIKQAVKPVDAYQYFRELQNAHYVQKALPETIELMEQSGARQYEELPHQKMQRLAQELELLEQELKELEKEQLPSQHFGLWSETEGQLQEIQFLKDQIENAFESDLFKINSQEKKSANYEDQINKAVDSILAEQVTQNEELNMAESLSMSNQVELVFDPALTSLGVKETELQKEQLKKYRSLDSQIDKLEKTIGVWNPLNRFMTLYQALDNLCEKVESFNVGGQIEQVGTKAKEFNKELDTLVNRFRNMKSIDYEPRKLDYLCHMVEKSFENSAHVQYIIDRLRSIEIIHKDSTNIANQFLNVEKFQSEEELGKKLLTQTKLIKETKDLLVTKVKEVQDLISKVKSA